MEVNEIAQAVRIIMSRILTPVVYLYETDFKIEFICFCNPEVTDDELYEVGEILTNLMSRTVEVVDIFEYDENDRMDIVGNARLVYAEHPVIEQLFTLSVAQEYKNIQEEKKNMLKRKNDNGAYYLQ